jgi:hypothetical protein
MHMFSVFVLLRRPKIVANNLKESRGPMSLQKVQVESCEAKITFDVIGGYSVSVEYAWENGIHTEVKGVSLVSLQRVEIPLLKL